MKTTLLLMCVFAANLVLAQDPILPDHQLTPGATVTNSVVEICKPGYSKSVRNVPESVKKQVFKNYFGSVPATPHDYEIDHLISLELGGSNSISNLWPQSYLGQWNAHEKDKLENRLHHLIEHTLATQGEAAASNRLHLVQVEISSNWTNAYLKYFGSAPED